MIGATIQSCSEDDKEEENLCESCILQDFRIVGKASDRRAAEATELISLT